MEIDTHGVNLTLRPSAREHIDLELARLESVVGHFPTRTAHVEVERSKKKGGFGVSIHVKLSTRSLFAQAWGGDLRSAVEATVDKLVRQAKRHIDRLREDEHPGAEGMKEIPEVTGPTAEELMAVRDLEDFCDQVAHHTARLHKFLRRELELDPRREELGDVVSVPDIVEEAVAYVFEHFRERPKEMTPDRWLLRRGLLFLDAELERAGAAPRDANLPPPERARELKPEGWEELLQLPAVELDPLEDRPAEASRTSPPILEDRREAREQTAAALRSLPERQRKALLLHHLEGYGVDEVAFVLNAEEPQVEAWLLEAETTLQDRLRSWRGI